MAGGDNAQPTQTTTNVLGPEQRQIFELAFPSVRAFAGQTPQRYQGSTVAEFDPAQVAGQEAALGAAGTQANLAGNAANATNFFFNDIWSPSSNAHLQGAVDAAVRPITNNLLESSLPAVRDEAVMSGTFGGSRQGNAEGLAIGRAAQAVGDTAAKVVNDNYATNINAQLKALGILPTVQTAQLAPAITTSGVGDVRQAQEQALLTEDVNNFNWDRIAPFLQGRELLSLIQGMPGGTTVSTGNNPSQPSAVMQGLGGAAAGATLGSALMPGVGTAAGAGAGALLPFLFR